MARRGGGKIAWLFLLLLASIAILTGLALVVHRPDRPVAAIEPGSSSGPAFVVQIIRPRLGLPVGGVLPPAFFGQEAHLGFDSGSADASIAVSPQRLELGAEGWDVVIAHNAEGRIGSETEAVFHLLFEEELRRVRCRTDDPAVGTFNTGTIADSGELSGTFDIELAHCEDAETEKPLGWPPAPLILHGSFDRLSRS